MHDLKNSFEIYSCQLMGYTTKRIVLGIYLVEASCPAKREQSSTQQVSAEIQKRGQETGNTASQVATC